MTGGIISLNGLTVRLGVGGGGICATPGLPCATSSRRAARKPGAMPSALVPASPGRTREASAVPGEAVDVARTVGVGGGAMTGGRSGSARRFSLGDSGKSNAWMKWQRWPYWQCPRDETNLRQSCVLYLGPRSLGRSWSAPCANTQRSPNGQRPATHLRAQRREASGYARES